MRLVQLAIAAVTCLHHPATATVAGPSLTPQQYVGDIEAFRRTMKERHVAPFKHLPEAEFDQKLDKLRTRSANLTMNQFAVELARIGALIRDGHTGVMPYFDRVLDLPILPIELWKTSDGWTIIGAPPVHADLLGARVTHIGGRSMADLEAALWPLYPRDSDGAIPKAVAALARTPAILEGAGLVRTAEEAQTLRLLMAGKNRTVRLPTFSRFEDMGRVAPNTFRTVGGPNALWMKNRNVAWWKTRLDDQTLYFQFNSADTGRPDGYDRAHFTKFAQELSDEISSMPKDAKLVIDMRWNSGGSYSHTKQLLNRLIETRRFNDRGNLFVLTSPLTFSAAYSHIDALETWLRPILVGEPGGGRPGHDGELARTRLPHSRMEVRASSSTNTNSIEYRPIYAPHLLISFSSNDLIEGRDPALEAISKFDPSKSLAAELEHVLQTQGSDAAKGRYEFLKRNARASYIFEEDTLHYLGLSIVDERPADALKLFELNAAEYPYSPHVYDNIGNALRKLGRRAEAIANFRKALSIDRRYYYRLADIEALESGVTN